VSGTSYLALWATLVGLLIGSFLNVVIARVPLGESVVSPRSRCGSCAMAIGPRDNIPVLSFVLLRGRCRGCQGRIGLRYPAVEVVTAAVFATVVLVIGADWRVPAFLWLAAAGVALAAIDLDTRRLPNVLTYSTFGAGAVLLLLPASLDDRWGDYGRAWSGAAVLGLVYLLLALARPGGMGLGDVKLATVLGFFLGFLGWDVLVVGAFVAFVLGAATAVGLMLVGRASGKTALPFGPFMLISALASIAVGPSVAGAYTSML
jgi:leader peptidase (prepilin peptidase)/N-methyltransferase